MKEKKVTFFLFLQFIVIRVIIESGNIVEESLNSNWKE